VALAATVFNKQLYLFGIGVNDKQVYLNTYNGLTWSGWAVIKSEGTTDVSVAHVVFNNKIALFSKGIKDNGIYVNWYK